MPSNEVDVEVRRHRAGTHQPRRECGLTARGRTVQQDEERHLVNVGDVAYLPIGLVDRRRVIEQSALRWVSPFASWPGRGGTISEWLLTPTTAKHWNESNASVWPFRGWTRVSFRDARSFVLGDADSRSSTVWGHRRDPDGKRAGDRSISSTNRPSTKPFETSADSSRRHTTATAGGSAFVSKRARTGGRSQSCLMPPIDRSRRQPPWMRAHVSQRRTSARRFTPSRWPLARQREYRVLGLGRSSTRASRRRW